MLVMKPHLELSLTALIVVLLSGASAHAVDICETHASLAARADDELCDYHVEAAKTCFQKLNLRYTYLQHRRSKTSTSEIMSEALPLKSHYESGIAVLRDNARQLDPESCGDQRETLGVLIEELESDLKGIDKRIKRLKAKPNAPESDGEDQA
jgi:hypothetical protein